jgi:alkylation response protein AidB-like acyl-CoA dehydrogenase
LKENLDPDEVDRTGDLPQEVIEGLAKLGCWGMKIPKEYGGLGLSQINYNRAVALVASYCGSTAVWLSAHQSIGVPQPLKLFGNEAQKKKYFPMFAKGASRPSP